MHEFGLGFGRDACEVDYIAKTILVPCPVEWMLLAASTRTKRSSGLPVQIDR